MSAMKPLGFQNQGWKTTEGSTEGTLIGLKVIYLLTYKLNASAEHLFFVLLQFLLKFFILKARLSYNFFRLNQLIFVGLTKTLWYSLSENETKTT